MSNKKQILSTVDDLVSNFLFYDRKEDEDLPRGAIESAIERGEISVDDIADRFRYLLNESLKS
tara:strand:- start:297 stop:485 length:189 start_codon:yes stop_codon:yes gene_type:complete